MMKAIMHRLLDGEIVETVAGELAVFREGMVHFNHWPEVGEHIFIAGTSTDPVVKKTVVSSILHAQAEPEVQSIRVTTEDGSDYFLERLDPDTKLGGELN